MQKEKLMRELQEELCELRKLKERISKSLIKLPPGTIRTGMLKKKYPQYFFVDEDTRLKKPHGRYLRKDEIDFAQKYIQNEYNHDLLEKIDIRIAEIDRINNAIPGTNIKDCYSNLSPAKKLLVNPYILPDEEFLKQWYENYPQNQNTYPYDQEFLTEKGELVRSKSEKMIADKLYSRNIPYVYEARLLLKNKVIYYPDFTLLNIRTRENFYLEHFGRMDDPEYCKKALEKIDKYEENGIFLGEELFVTFESSKKAINMKQIDNIIDRFLV